jgi:hypothetical protein
MIGLRLFGLAAAVLCGIAANAIADDAVVLHPDGAYTQASTGMTYPATVGDFQRVDITRAGTDERAHYRLDSAAGQIAVSVRVFKGAGLTLVGAPPPQMVLDALHKGICFQGADKDMTALAADAVRTDTVALSLRRGMFSSQDGYKASYTLTLPSLFDRTQVAAHSDVYRFCFIGDTNWTVEYRFDTARDADASKQVAAFMHDLDWTMR